MNFAADAMNALIESQIFFPQTYWDFTPDEYGLDHQDIWITTSDGVRIHGWLIPSEANRALFLFYHGNAGNISHRLDNVKRLHELGLTVLIVDYRGYGKSEGKITEKGMYLDAEAAHAKATEIAEEAGIKLVVFGRSLGGIAAVHACAGRHCAGLILESTFTNLGDMARAFFPVPFIATGLEHRFNALGEIGRVKAPILFFHGDRDELVSYEFGKALYEGAPEPKEFVTLTGAGHNDTYLVEGQSYFDKISSFIDGL
jgi:fermentation-respiration switch protein FrsA (DUF1100 family)